MKRIYKPDAYQRKLQKQREWHQRNKRERQIENLSNIPDKVIKTPLFEILDVLRKDNRHYLWGRKSVSKWTVTDWIEFNKLKSA